MPTHAAVEGFDRAADAYERGRPGYPPDAIGAVVEALGIGPGRRVLELGSGTGKFTRTLLGTGAGLVAVEPTRAMRRVFGQMVPEVPLLAAQAERLPFRDATVDAVVAAQAFHWFATPAAVDEIARVLRPGGGLGLLWNTRDESVAWRARLGALMNDGSSEAPIPRYRSGGWRSVFRGRREFTSLVHRRFPHSQTLDERTLIDRVLSVSFIALRPEAERQALARRVHEILESDPETRGRPTVELTYRTDLYLARRRPPGPPPGHAVVRRRA